VCDPAACAGSETVHAPEVVSAAALPAAVLAPSTYTETESPVATFGRVPVRTVVVPGVTLVTVGASTVTIGSQPACWLTMLSAFPWIG
jgi:hypothetical protein